MKLSNLAVKRPITIAMVFLVIILLGTVSMSKLGLDLFPELEMPMALVMTSYENVGPEEMENLVTRPLESALGTVSGIQNINSYSQQGSSMVMLEFAWGTDMNFAINQMRDKVDFIAPFLPTDVDKPMILKLDPNMMPIMVMGFSGDSDLVALDKLATDVIQPRLERVEGVATVTISGGVKREIRISVIPQRLQAYGLSFEQIISQLRMENRDTSVGAIEEGLKEQMVRVVGEFSSIQEVEDLQIASSSGSYIRLADIARIEDTLKDKKQFVYMDGKPSVQIAVQRQTDANTVKVSEAVIQELTKLKKELPQNLTVNVGFDQADFIRLALDQVKGNALIGAGLAILILFLFLRNIRSTLVVGVAIPISVLATFSLIYFGGLTLNLITLGGLALGVGMMVDNSIVILENIYRYRQEGYGKIEAAKKGAAEVGLAVIASTLTTIVVFLPIIYVEGLASQIFRPMALTVSFALLASLFVALTLVPMLASKILKVVPEEVEASSGGTGGAKNSSGGKRKGFKAGSVLVKAWGRGLSVLDELYRRLLVWALQHRKAVVFLAVALLVASIAAFPLVGMEFLPKQDNGEYTVNITLPNGTAVRETQRTTKLVQQYLEELPEHEWAIYAVGADAGMIGSGSTPEKAVIRGKLKEKKQRARSLDEVLDELRVRCAAIPGAKIEIMAMDLAMGGLQTSIAIHLTGDNLDVLGRLAETVAERVKSVEGTREVTTSLEDGRPEVHLKLQRQKAEQYGIGTAQLSSFLSTAINGTTATRYREKGEEIDVRLVLAEQYRQNISSLESLMLSSPTGTLVHLHDIATLEMVQGPTQIERYNQTRRISITGDISGRDLKSVARDIQVALDDFLLPQGVQLELGGANKEMVKAFQDLSLALLLAIVLVYMILASQFEGLLYPFVIMFAIPPTLIGVVFSLLLTGRTLSVPTFIGIIMLAGIVVNNAIVLVDYINTLRKRDGLSREEAILKAGPIRLRPILMTSLTTILALLPAVLGMGEGSEFSAPMATAVSGGLAVSTVITLILIPCLYIIADDFGLRIKRIFRDKKNNEVEPLWPPVTEGE